MKGVSPALVPELLLSFQRPFRSRRAVERYQEAALRRLVEHAFERVPFYRRHFERHGLRPADVRRLADLHRLPTVGRRELQKAALADRLARGVELARCHSYETSGSSGEPLRIVRTPHEDARLFGRRLRAQILSGLRPWDLRVNIGSPRRIFRWHRMGAFRIDTVENRPPYDDLLERVHALHPDVLMVTPETLGILVEQAARGSRLALRHLFTGANQLRPSLRRRAESTFEAPVTDFYGTSECSLVAWECGRCGRYHTSDDSVIVELIREDGVPAAPGEEGEVILTVLHSHAMPFLRLRLGDLARRPLEPRDCAIRFGAIESVEGRVIDYLRFPGGQSSSPFRVLNSIDEIEGLGRWHLLQHTETGIVVRFETLPGIAEDRVAAAIRAACAALFPSEVRVDVLATRFGDDGGTAKLRFVHSLPGSAAPFSAPK